MFAHHEKQFCVREKEQEVAGAAIRVIPAKNTLLECNLEDEDRGIHVRVNLNQSIGALRLGAANPL